MKKLSKDEIRWLKERVRALRIRIVDISSYPATKALPRDSYVITIMAGHVIGKACVMSVDISGDDFTFNIYGQLKEAAWQEAKYNHFSDLRRQPVGSESYGGGTTFRINHYTGYARNLTVRGKIAEGMDFFKKFLDLYGMALEDNKFSQYIHVWFVPEYSDELLQMTGSVTGHHPEAYAYFNSKVKAKFPKGFFIDS